MIRPLTSLRFVFALLVFVSHLSFLLSSDDQILVWLYRHIFYEGFIGVSFFFILSGFILAFSYKRKLESGETSLRKFLVARISRIYPMHFFTLLIAVLLSRTLFYEDVGLWVKQFLLNLFLLQSYFPDDYFSFNAPSWSISDEWFFYLLFPFLIRWTSRLKKLDFYQVFGVSVILILFLNLVITPEYQHAVLYIHPFTRLADFVLGIFLFDLYEQLKNRELKVNFTLLEFLSVGSMTLFFSLHEFVPKGLRYSMFYWLPICFLILVFAFHSGKLSRLLSHRILVFLGEISFSFYLFHLLVLRILEIVDRHYSFFESDWIHVFTALGCTIVFSTVSFFFIEKPVGRWMKKRLS